MKEHKHKREMRFPTWALCAAISLLLGVISPAAWGQDDECHPEEIPNLDQWLLSGHADGEAEAFTHWDEDDPPEVSSRCAKCPSAASLRSAATKNSVPKSRRNHCEDSRLRRRTWNLCQKLNDV